MKLLYKNKVLLFVFVCIFAFSAMSLSIISGGILDTLTVYEGQTRLGSGTSIVFTADDSVSAGTQATYKAKLFGFIPLKTVRANIVAPTDLIAGGYPFGVKLLTDGVIVTGFENANAASSPYNSGVRSGDIITEANGQKVSSNEEFSRIVASSSGKPIVLSIVRGTTPLNLEVTPILTSSGTYRLGLWVRDSTAGIGTVTFADPQSGVIAGLGHGICDVDTGVLLPLYSGSLVGATIKGVVKGQKGNPGELLGSFDENIQIASLYKNTNAGIFGEVLDTSSLSGQGTYPVGKQTEVKAEKAHILCDVGDGTKEYEIEILKIMGTGQANNKNMLISVTDKTLLDKTGGIVQGMSGSPIIQNGKLIGAVTHVLISDPTRGYGIFIENMLNAAA